MIDVLLSTVSIQVLAKLYFQLSKYSHCISPDSYLALIECVTRFPCGKQFFLILIKGRFKYSYMNISFYNMCIAPVLRSVPIFNSIASCINPQSDCFLFHCTFVISPEPAFGDFLQLSLECLRSGVNQSKSITQAASENELTNFFSLE